MKERPNIILIITDQQRYETIQALGYPHVETPHLDKLVHEGVSFSNCHVTSPSCCPSRASLFTGHFPHNSGVQRNNDPWPRTWTEDLRDAGYYCVNVGKMHADPYTKMHGFHERFIVENKQRRIAEPLWSGNPHVFDDDWDKALAAHGFSRPEKPDYLAWPDAKERQGCFEWKLPEHLHPDVFTGELALRWIEKAPKEMEEPLFLEIGFPGPHGPYDPIEGYVEPYLEKDLPVLPVTREEMENQPATIQSLRERFVERCPDSVAFDPEASDEQRKRQRAYYLANVTMIDEQVGRILDALEGRGMLENSVVLFTSDHGDCLGDHGLVEKWSMYDSSVRVPLVVWSPDRCTGNRSIDALTQWFDIGPTILELAGANPLHPMEAESLVPLLSEDPETEEREYIFSEAAPDFMLQNAKYVYMVRDKRYKLIDYRGTGEGQLFDLETDPDELNNLWSSSDHGATRKRLEEALNNWMADSISQFAGWWLENEK